MTQVQPLRIGLVGYGKGGRFFHAPLIAAAAGCGSAGVATRWRSGGVISSATTPVRRRCSTTSAQLASAGADAVAISTPADTHVPLVLEAVSLGLPEAGLLFGPVMSVYAELDDAGGRPGRFFIAMRHAGGVVSHLVGDLLLHGVPGLRFPGVRHHRQL